MSLEQINNRIEELYKQWLSLQPLKREDDERLWKKIRLEWNYNSNRIEGNTLTYSETELLCSLMIKTRGIIQSVTTRK